jgi:hypothetical protein
MYDLFLYDNRKNYLKLISKGLLSDDPKILNKLKKIKDAYLHIVSSDKFPLFSYKLYFTESKDQLDKQNVIKTYFVPNFKEKQKIIIHKLQSYKRMVNNVRYYYAINSQDLILACDNIFNDS